MPPRGTPLPDHPDDWQADESYPQFEGKNFTRGCYSAFAPEPEDDEDELGSDFEAKVNRLKELNAKKNAEQHGKKKSVVKKSALQTSTRDLLGRKESQGLTARGVADALAKKHAGTPSFAMPTSSARAKGSQAKKPTPAISVPGKSRHTVAKVASNSTLGYSKGRAVSASKRMPLAGVYEEEEGAPADSAKGRLDELFGLGSLEIKDEDADLGLGSSGIELERDNSEQLFQLDIEL
jgi:hypothetical protein